MEYSDYQHERAFFKAQFTLQRIRQLVERESDPLEAVTSGVLDDIQLLLEDMRE